MFGGEGLVAPAGRRAGLDPLRGSQQPARRWHRDEPGVGRPQRVGITTILPQCDLTASAANGECGPWITPNFGSANVATIYDAAAMNGWGSRPYNWEFSGGVQQEIAPRISASFGYFSRVFGNFFVVDNENLAKTDFTPYSVTVPTDARLPNSGQTVTGLYDQNFIVASKNVIKNSSAFGTQQQHWNGVDFSVDARLKTGLFLQASGSGRTTTTTRHHRDVPGPHRQRRGIQPQVTGAAAGGDAGVVLSPGDAIPHAYRGHLYAAASACASARLQACPVRRSWRPTSTTTPTAPRSPRSRGRSNAQAGQRDRARVGQRSAQ
jgi:hypothetical protein